MFCIKIIKYFFIINLEIFQFDEAFKSILNIFPFKFTQLNAINFSIKTNVAFQCKRVLLRLVIESKAAWC